mmetsp:Transcript_114145/g.322784  ORF Transcript_114145/g.322784 Transcript_114145/m.322784 type:complete len:216 (-) Transcript_114145:89-736(-)
MRAFKLSHSASIVLIASCPTFRRLSSCITKTSATRVFLPFACVSATRFRASNNSFASFSRLARASVTALTSFDRSLLKCATSCSRLIVLCPDVGLKLLPLVLDGVPFRILLDEPDSWLLLVGLGGCGGICLRASEWLPCSTAPASFVASAGFSVAGTSRWFSISRFKPLANSCFGSSSRCVSTSAWESWVTCSRWLEVSRWLSTWACNSFVNFFS